MTLADWERAVCELEALTVRPNITVWGGEPLVSAVFKNVTECLAGFKCALVTNGTLMEKHAALLERYYKRVYVSLDGTREVHDALRGEGVFDKAVRGIKSISKEKVTLMCVATKELDIGRFAAEFEDYEIILHQQIPFSGAAVNVGTNLPKNVTARRHGKEALLPCCGAPWKHMHLHWNGDVNFCTDFYDYTIGNFREASLCEIFSSVRAEAFRGKVSRGEYKNCEHCSWKNSESFYIE